MAGILMKGKLFGYQFTFTSCEMKFYDFVCGLAIMSPSLGQKERRRCVSLGVAAVYWLPVKVDSPLGETVFEMRLLKVFVSVEVLSLFFL